MRSTSPWAGCREHVLAAALDGKRAFGVARQCEAGVRFVSADEVVDAVGSAIASGLVEFRAGRLTATPRLREFVPEAEALQRTARADYHAGRRDIVVDDDGHPRPRFPLSMYLAEALRDVRPAAGQWSVQVSRVEAYLAWTRTLNVSLIVLGVLLFGATIAGFVFLVAHLGT